MNDKKQSVELKDYIDKAVTQDLMHYSVVALPVISLFEVYMIINWALNFDHTFLFENYAYLFSYCLILFSSLGFYIYSYICKKNGFEHRNRIKRILLCQKAYGIMFFAWSVFMTFLDAKYRGNFDVLIYVTIITITPILSYINPKIWCTFEGIAYFIIVSVAYYEPHFTGFLINFTVFTIISIVASIVLFKIRTTGYERQYELEDARNKDHFYAYYDILTGLKNKRSFFEDLKNISDTEDIVIGIVDIQKLREINVEHSFDFGDLLIKSTAKIISDLIGENGEVYRVTGDDFYVIAKNLNIDTLSADLDNKAFEWNGLQSAPLKLRSYFRAVPADSDVSLKDLFKELNEHV